MKETSLLYKDRTIRSPEDGYILFKPFLGELDREYFVVMCLDVKNSGVSACALRNIDGNYHRIRQAGGLIWFAAPAAGHLPPPRHPGRARPAVLPLRPLAPGGHPPAHGHHQPALPGPAGDAARDRRRPGRGPGRPGGHGHRSASRDRLADAGVPRASALPGRDPGGQRDRGPFPGQAGAGPPAGGPRHHAPGVGAGFLTSPRSLIPGHPRGP